MSVLVCSVRYESMTLQQSGHMTMACLSGKGHGKNTRSGESLVGEGNLPCNYIGKKHRTRYKANVVQFHYTGMLARSRLCSSVQVWLLSWQLEGLKNPRRFVCVSVYLCVLCVFLCAFLSVFSSPCLLVFMSVFQSVFLWHFFDLWQKG